MDGSAKRVGLTIKDGGKDPGFSSMYGKHYRKHNFFLIVVTKRLKRVLVIGQPPAPADKKVFIRNDRTHISFT
jgi:hypothetical protein